MIPLEIVGIVTVTVIGYVLGFWYATRHNIWFDPPPYYLSFYQEDDLE